MATLETHTRRIAIATLALAGVGLGARLVGLLEKQVLAYYFGTGFEVDAFFVAVSVPTTLLFGAVRDLIDPSFQPLFVRLLGESRERRALALALLVAGVVLAAGAVIATLVALRPEALVQVLAPGFGPEANAVAVRLLRVMAPAIAILSLSALTQVVLNGYRRFALPASGDLVLKALPILACVALFHRLGVMALALGLLAGACGRLALHLVGLGAKLRLLSWPDRDARRELTGIARLMAPLVVAVAFTQLGELAANLFASMAGTGGVASRTFAKKIVELPLMLLAYGLATVLFPHFSQLVASGTPDRLMALLGRASRGFALIFAPITVATVFLAEPIVTLILERGQFGLDARLMTAAPLRIYALGMIALAIDAILIPAYFALRDTRVPMIATATAVIVEIAVASLLMGHMGVAGVALAFVVARTVRVLVLARCLRQHHPAIDFGSVARAASPIIATTALATLVAWAYVTWIPTPAASALLLSKLLHLGLGGVSVVAAAAASAWILRVPELRQVAGLVGHWRRHSKEPGGRS